MGMEDDLNKLQSGEDLCLTPIICESVECDLCGWSSEIGVPLDLGPYGLEVMCKYETLCHSCSHHPEIFQNVTGRDPVAALAVYDQEIAAMGMLRIETGGGSDG